MAGDCDLMDRKKLKCALEFSFIGLCKNIFECSKTRITVHGEIQLKTNNEEMCTLNFDDTITPGVVDNSTKCIVVEELSTYYKTPNIFFKSLNDKVSKADSKSIELGGVVPNVDIIGKTTLESDGNHLNVFTKNLNENLSSSLCNMPRTMDKSQTELKYTSSQPASNNQYFTANNNKLIKENSKVVNNKLKGQDRIRCCACKHSDVDDGSWDDDKTSVIVDDDDVSEKFEAGKLCLESLDYDDEFSQESRSLNGKTLTANMERYASLLSKLKSQTPDTPYISNSTTITGRTINQNSRKDSPTNHVPDLHILNNLWRKNSRYRHVCIICGMAFTFRTNLTRHTKKIHGCRPDKIHSDNLNKENPTRPK